MTGLLFLIFLALAVILNQVPFWILIFYLVLSLLTFIYYAIDKSAAQNGKSRVRENTLHILSLAGGWPGALAAQEKLRHKTIKRSFRTWYWIMVILNVLILAGLLFSGATVRIESFIMSLM